MKLRAEDFLTMKGVRRIAMLTAYNCPVARCIERGGIPVILVGDSVGMVEMGFASTREVTLEHMEYHVAAVRRGAPHTHVIGDLPYLSDTDPGTALASARRLLAAGADSVKLEGPKRAVIAHLVDNGIPVVGHTGLTPQTATDFRKVGLDPDDARRIQQEAETIQDAGAFMVVLEHIPSHLGKAVTAVLRIPTIGIGAGPDCDGQVLVINDAMGMGDYWPPFSKQYAHVGDSITGVARMFAGEVESGEFPNNILEFAKSGN